jgi:hypothetical protein
LPLVRKQLQSLRGVFFLRLAGPAKVCKRSGKAWQSQGD